MEIYKGDQSTVFSIVPWDIMEQKPGLYPGLYKIPKCLDENKPERLIVGGAIHYKYIPDQPKPDAVETLSYRIAESIVNDFLDGQLWTTPYAKPGICWFHSVVPTEEFLKHEEYGRIKHMQKNWFKNVVEKTTDDYKRYKTFKVVGDQARFAARYLGLDPEWLHTEASLEWTKCPACATRNEPGNAVCVSCSCILDQEKFSKLKFAKMAH